MLGVFFSLNHTQREQLASHEGKVAQLEESLREHTHGSPPTKGLSLQNYIEKENYLQFEVKIKKFSKLLSIEIFFKSNIFFFF